MLAGHLGIRTQSVFRRSGGFRGPVLGAALTHPRVPLPMPLLRKHARIETSGSYILMSMGVGKGGGQEAMAPQ